MSKRTVDVLGRLAELLQVEGYAATLEYPAFVCVQIGEDGRTLNMGFEDSELTWTVLDACFEPIEGDWFGAIKETSGEDAILLGAVMACEHVKAKRCQKTTHSRVDE